MTGKYEPDHPAIEIAGRVIAAIIIAILMALPALIYALGVPYRYAMLLSIGSIIVILLMRLD